MSIQFSSDVPLSVLQVSVSPPFLLRFADDLLESASYAGISSFLVSSASDLSLRSLLRLLESLTGRPGLETDSASLAGDTGGASEARWRQWATRAGERSPCLAALNKANRMGRNREGKVDYRCANYS